MLSDAAFDVLQYVARIPTSQCPLEHCMLSDFTLLLLTRCLTPKSLNALSSIVCFLTNPRIAIRRQ